MKRNLQGAGTSIRWRPASSFSDRSEVEGSMRIQNLTYAVLFSLIAILLVNEAEAQFQRLGAPMIQQAAAQADDDPKKEPKKPEGPVTDTSTLAVESPEVDENYVRFHMWDGSVIGGAVQSPSIPVDTDFGPLVIPVSRIIRLHPGLDSLPDFKSSVEGLLKGLGDRDFDTREKSHRALAAMGPQIRTLLNNYNGQGSAERKKRLSEIKAEIDEIIEDYADDDESPGERALIAGDLIETPDFSIVGKIKQPEFIVASKFGQLRVELGDIKMADRSFKQKAEELRKNVTVGGEAFFQREAVSTRIRVNLGDRVKIKASGIVNWTNWSTSSSPDGLTNQGQYLGINCGTLCAKIGKSNDLIKIGRDGEFVAKKSGVLYLGIAMQDNYSNRNSGYRWTGEYKAKIRVMPAVE